MRKDYSSRMLRREDLDANPMKQFERWMSEAIQAQMAEPHACCLSTCGEDGQPEGRMVLLRGVDQEGMVFFTNYNSHKGKQLSENPRAGLTFFWDVLERQVRIAGVVSRLNDNESDDYFQSRPRGSRIGAWASPQSNIVESRTELNRLMEVTKSAYAEDMPIPRPEYWGGYRLQPLSIEFWQGRPSRLHDRLRYRRDSLDTEWIVERLAP
jgi:pyridoxamine 5'-phosphate oxidase